MIHGSTRSVFLVGRFAIKIPRCWSWRTILTGLLANLQEAEWARTEWASLCPVLYANCGGFFLVMKRARPLTDAEWAALDVDAFLSQEGCRLPVEAKRDSFGMLGERVVAVDYGS